MILFCSCQEYILMNVSLPTMLSFDTNCYGSGFVLTFLMPLQINILHLHLCYHNAEGETQARKASVWEHAIFARLEPDSSRQAGKS